MNEVRLLGVCQGCNGFMNVRLVTSDCRLGLDWIGAL